MLRILLIVFVCSCSLLSSAQSADSLKPRSTKVQVTMSQPVHNILSLYQARAKKHPQIAGYRLQIFNGRKDDCLSQRGKFLRAHPQKQAYLLYEVPEYKTQVGNFRSRLEAEAFLNQIIDAFPGSFIISTKIDQPPLEQ